MIEVEFGGFDATAQRSDLLFQKLEKIILIRLKGVKRISINF